MNERALELGNIIEGNLFIHRLHLEIDKTDNQVLFRYYFPLGLFAVYPFKAQVLIRLIYYSINTGAYNFTCCLLIKSRNEEDMG